MSSSSKRTVRSFVYLLLCVLTCTQQAAAEIQVSYRFNLANLFGPVPSMWAKLAVDREKKEVYVLNPTTNIIGIYNPMGMETYSFGESFSGVLSMAIGEGGDIFLLTRKAQGSVIKLCDYRGVAVSEVSLRNLPELHAHFAPDQMVYHQQSLYLFNTETLEMLITDQRGEFKKAHWLKPLIRKHEELKYKSSKKKKQTEDDLGINGFTVDDQGNMYFTLPMLFSVFKLSADGQLSSFGGSGSVPGKFGITSGIAVDERGNIFVTDRLRSVVSVFDKDFNYQTEFGWRGDRPANLIAPDSIVLDSDGNIYVSQAANRGVSVFRIKYQ